MTLNKLARIFALCLIFFITALTAFAQPPIQPCTCEYCSRGSANRSCTMDSTTTTCGYFLAVTTCLPTSSPAASKSSVDATFLSLTSDFVQAPVCMALGN